MNEISDLELVQAARQDVQAFTQLYQQHVEEVYRYVLVRVGLRAEAEDLTSTVWEKVLQRLPNFMPSHKFSFRAWLFRITKNCLIDFYRQGKRHNFLELEQALEIQTGEFSQAEALQQTQELIELKKILKSLPPLFS